MRDYSTSSPPNLFPQPHQQKTTISVSSASTPISRIIVGGQAVNSRRRGNDQMGEGLYNNTNSTISAAMDESNGNESPKKRARTGSLSDHEMDTTNELVNGDATHPNSIIADQPIVGESSSDSTDDSPSTPPSKVDQLNILQNSILACLEISSTVYLFPTKWYDAFNSWARETGQDPGRVDPAGVLLDLDGVLREDAIEGRDWRVTNQEGWSLIQRCHGADSEVSRKVIPTSPTSNQPVIELRPPELLLTKIVAARSVTAELFDFSPIQSSQATSIIVSKSDTLFTLDDKIRTHLGFLSAGSIRCYKFPCKRGDSVHSEWSTRKAFQEIPDRDDILEFDLKSKTVGEVGIVEPYIGIAVEWKGLGNSWPMDEETLSEQSSIHDPSDVPVGGRTLGGIPGSSFTALNTSRGRTIEKSLFESEDDDSSSQLGRLNGQVVFGPVLPNSYNRTSNTLLLRSSSADRSTERFKTPFNARFSSQTPKDDRIRGTTGLNNLGNTCYMNSALQCLSHCKELTEYFLAQVYKSELNETNPLGMNGLLAKSYSYLIAALFNPAYQKSSFPPSEFKKTIGRFAPNFSGYGQQDSQEFLAFLLDGLHEDLNRVRKKPYVERDELIGVLPSEDQLRLLGQKSWDGHKLRNDSVIVDLCQGMYKSTVVCPVCDVVSVTFDPFMDLSVPLPIKQTWKHPGINYIPHEGKPLRIPAELPKTAYIKDLKRLIGERMNVDPATLLSAEIFSRKFYKHHTDNMLLADVLPDPSKDDVTIYELPNLNLPDSVLLPVFSGFWSPRTYYTYSNRFEEFGIPFYIVLTPQEVVDYDRIYEKIRNKYSQFSTAEELHQPPPQRVEESSEEDERSVDDVMQEVVLTRQELNQNQTMVIIRHQPYSKFMSRFGDVEMPVNTDKVEQLLDLKEILRPRMQSTAPSAMESVHRDVSSTPPESQNGEAIQPDPLDNQPEHTGQGGFEVVSVGEIQDESEGVYFGQHGTYVDPSSINDPQEHNSFEPLQENDTFDPPDENNSFDEHDGLNPPQSSSFGDPDQTFLGPDTTLTNQLDPDLDHSESGLRFSESDVLNIDDENRSLPSMIDSEDNIPPSQLGRAHAPSPAVTDSLPSYAQLYPSSSDPQSTFDHTFKFGDALVCEWTVQAFEHIFGNSKAHWDMFEAWTDPSPPVADSTPKKLHLDLDDCLDEFAREEELGQDDLWYCPRCKEHRQAKKTLQLWRVPDIFAVHLKRFSANRGFRDKLDNLIEFPIVDLDLTDRVGDKKWIADERGGEKLVYDLFAVDNHYGGLGGGHYTAYAQNFIDSKWYYFDDSNVRPARAEDAVTAAAYLLFYRRRSESPLGGNTSKLIADALALKSEESSDSTTPSPKVDDRSATSSPVPLLTNINPLNTFMDSRSIESIYSPLRNLASTTALWKGGWSNRANTGFNFGTSTMMQTESPSVQSQNVTSEEQEEVDLTNDEEVEVVGMEDMTENDEAEEVQLIRIDPMDGDQTA